MPNYLLLLRKGDQRPETLGPAEWQAMFGRFVAWTDDLHRRGQLRVVERLEPSGEARLVRRRGQTIAVDGPFAESKEAVIGLYIVSAPSFADAVDVARDAPILADGVWIEVHAIADFPRPS